MKQFLLPVLIIILFASCKSNTKQPLIDSASNTTVVDHSKELIAEFKPIMQGVWVKKSYVDKVIATRSPLAAVDEALDMTALLFDRNTIQGDSLMVLVGWGNHDSSEMTLRFKPGTRKHSLLFGLGELQYAIVNRDTLLTLYWPDEKTHHTKATMYKKSPVKSDDLGSGLEYFINKGLVTGDYVLKDSTGNTSKVSFNTNGKISGFQNFTNYGINIDLNTDAMDNLDEIGFNNGKGAHKWYSFKINADTLKLYETRPNSDSSLLILDKLKYTLIKQQ
ncbi:MAG: hypothetical protein V4456_13485 [Bacteroidota bacterium]